MDDEAQEIVDNLADLARVLKVLGKNADSLTCTRAAIWIAGQAQRAEVVPLLPGLECARLTILNAEDIPIQPYAIQIIDRIIAQEREAMNSPRSEG